MLYAFLYNLDDLTSEILGSYVRFQKWSKMSDHYEKQEISLIEIGKKLHHLNPILWQKFNKKIKI